MRQTLGNTSPRLLSTTGVLGGAFLTSGNAMACGTGSTLLGPELPLFLVVFLFCLALTFLLTAIVWSTARLVCRGSEKISAASLAASILSVLLALLCLFALPHFESTYSSAGVELPLQTEIVVSLRYLLLLPLIALMSKATLRRLDISDKQFYIRAMVAESVTLGLVLWCIYSPIFKLC